jgi:hypothetical protein
MTPQDNSANPLEETNQPTTSVFGVRLYHLRTVFWTYLVWTLLNLWFASLCCEVNKFSLIWIPYYWALLHIIPLLLLLTSRMDAFGIELPVLYLLSAVFLIAGLLINKWWTRF